MKYMKRILLPLLFSCLAILPVRADLVMYEGFNYADGNLTNVSSGIWAWVSGSGNDLYVSGSKLQVAATGGSPVSRQDDASRSLSVTNGSVYTNASQVLYASFTVNCTNLPNSAGTYFAAFYNPIAGASGGFWARVFAGTAQTGLPNTWRLGISGRSGTVSKIYPVDLALNTDYQVVVQWDPVTDYNATIWVSPVSSASLSIGSIDGLTPPTNFVNSFAFRQAGTFGNFFGIVSNLAVATTFDDAATNIWAATPVAPVIARAPVGSTNFAGDNVLLSGIAAGQGLGNMTYTWLKDGGIFPNPNGNTNTLNFVSALTTDSGEYQLVATTPYGLSATSTVAKLLVNISFAPPTITVQPATNTIGYFGSSATLTLTAVGPGPLSYTWLKAGNVVSGPNPTPAYTLTGLTALDAGTYVCGVTNANGGVLSSNAVLVVTNPPAVSIAYLRTLVDPVTFLPTNSTSLWEATGTVSTFTNTTSGNTSSYYLQDSTAGINIFITLGSTFRPAQGDVVKFVGVLSSFNGALELYADGNDSFVYPHSILSNNVALLPVPRTIPVALTNTINTTYTRTNLEGSIVMLTNVFFGTNAGTVTSGTANTTVVVTNSSGRSFGILFASQQSSDVGNKTLPEFAYTVAGPLTYNSGVALNGGFQVTVTRFSDVVTNALTITNTHAGNSSTLTWDAAPYTYSYSAWAATAVTGPYVLLTNKLRFIDASGTFTDSNAGGTQKYYRLTTP